MKDLPMYLPTNLPTLTHLPEKVKPDLKTNGGKGTEEHDGNGEVEDDQEELRLLPVALEVSPARVSKKDVLPF